MTESACGGCNLRRGRALPWSLKKRQDSLRAVRGPLYRNACRGQAQDIATKAGDYAWLPEAHCDQ